MGKERKKKSRADMWQFGGEQKKGKMGRSACGVPASESESLEREKWGKTL